MNTPSLRDFSVEEQSILCVVLLYEPCNITLIRNQLRHTSQCFFSTKELNTEVPVLLKTLLKKGYLIREDIEYSLAPKFDIHEFKALIDSRDIQKQVQNTVDNPEPTGVYCNRDKIPYVFCKCCAVWHLLGNSDKVKRCIEACNEWRKHHYFTGDNINISRSAVRFLTTLPGAMDNLALFSEQLRKELLPYAVFHAMIHGKPFDFLLNNWRKDSRLVPIEDTPLYLTAAFLENDIALLTDIARKCLDKYKPLLDALLAMRCGDWKAADQRFTRYLNEELNTFANSFDITTVMVLFPAIVTACVSQASVSRFNRWFGILDKESGEILRFSRQFYMLRYACDKEPLREYNAAFSNPFALFLKLATIALSPRIPIPRDEVENGFRQGRKLLEDKQIVLGIYLLNCVGTMLPVNDARRSEIEALTKSSAVVPIFPMVRKLEEWEIVLESLVEFASKGAAAQKNSPPLEGKFYWLLETGKDYYFAGNKMILHTILPMFARCSKRGGFCQGKPVSMEKLQSGEMDTFLTPEEMSVKGFIDYDKINVQAIKHLINSDNVFLSNGATPVKVVEEKNTILSKRNTSGETELTLKYSGYIRNAEVSVFVDTQERGMLRYCCLTSCDPLLRFWAQHCDSKGKIIIPARGTEKLSETAAQFCGAIPVSGVLAQEAYRNLPQKAGQVELHARLNREEELFLIDFFNKPFEDDDWMPRPGQGQAGRMVERPDGAVVLQRNLSQEREAFRKLLAACPALPASVAKTCNAALDDIEQILQILAQLKESGVIMDWNTATPLKISSKLNFANLHLSGSSAADWFAIGGELRISEEKVLSLQEILNALDRKVGSFIQLDDQSYLQLTRDLLKKLELLKVSGSVSKGTLHVSPAALPMLSAAFETGLPENLQKQVERINAAFASPIPLPSNLNGTLRAYQEEGFRYLAHLADCRIGCCLADDMGLGKTIQLLALLLREAPQGPALVIAPASLCRNWEREAQKFAPSLHTQILPMFDREKIIKQADKGDLILTSYGIVQSEAELFSAKKWHTVILDEAQAIKNHTAKRSKSAKELQADIRIAATGTPIENHLLELWSIFDFLNPGLLGGSTTFEQKFCDNAMPKPELKKLVAPLIMRRRKSDVLDDLPPKTEITLQVELSDNERNMYEVLRRKAVAELDGKEESRIAILASLTKLRRFCCAPPLVWEGAEPGSKVQRLLELAEEMKAAGHRALIFSQYVDFLSILRKGFERAGLSYQYLDGATAPAKRMQAVDAFQNGEGDFFLISLKAGGVGLNLTAANYVIIADPWWNPAVEDQAADRVHRIGQHDPVTVYRLIATGTVEEKILALHARKKQVSEDILSNAQSAGITAGELMALLDNQ